MQYRYYFSFIICSAFLNFNYFKWGYDFILHQHSDFFPYINFCEFPVWVLGNSVQTYTVQCFYSINLFNNIMFITLWIWFTLLLLYNIIALLHWIIVLTPRYRINYFTRYIYGRNIQVFFLNYISSDLFLFVLYIENYGDSMLVTQFVKKLFDVYDAENFNKDFV